MESIKQMVNRIDSMKKNAASQGSAPAIAEQHFDYMTNIVAAYPYLRKELDRLWEIEKMVESGMVAA